MTDDETRDPTAEDPGTQDGLEDPVAAPEEEGPPAGSAPGDGPPVSEAGESDDERPEPASPDEVATTAKEFVSGLLEAMGLTGEVGTSVDGPTAHVDVTGDDLGTLIGRRGQTLDALQEVTRAAVQRRLRSRVRLAVDVEGYRARRRDSLAEYARDMAQRAKERGTEIELEPMTSYERKVVHDAVGEIDGASSFSEGEEPNRKVVIRGEEQ
jgi:spoIIIJ-associated protein